MEITQIVFSSVLLVFVLNLDQPSLSKLREDESKILDVFLSNIYTAGKYWSPGRLEDVSLQRPQDVS